MFAIHFVDLLFCDTCCTVGTIIEVMAPITAVVTSSSTIVNPLLSRRDVLFFILFWGWSFDCAVKMERAGASGHK
jgi:hypothetical protein